MALLIPYDASGIDGKLRTVIDDIIGRIQIWAGKVDGVNTAERLNELSTGVASLPTVQVGTIHAYAGATAPTGYLLCDGSAVSRTTYANLFAVTGTTYGAGDGSITFNIPNLRQRFPLGKAASGTGSTLGETGGAIDHTHTGPSHTHTGPSHTHTISGTTASESAHTHSFSGNTGEEAQIDFTGSGSLDGAAGSPKHTHPFSGTTGAGSAHSHGVGTLATGSDGTGNTGASGTGNTGTANPPYLVIQFIVKT